MIERIEDQDHIVYQCKALKPEDPYQIIELNLVSGKNLLKQRTQAFKWWSLPPAVGGKTRSKIVKAMAKNGILSAVFSRDIVRDAVAQAIVPDNYELHHNHPLALGGNNKKKNYRLIHQKAHTLLHKYVLDPMQVILQSEQIVSTNHKRVYLKMPILPAVITTKEIGLFLTPLEIEAEKDYLQETKKTTKKIMYEKERKKPKIVTHHVTSRGKRGYGKRMQGYTR